jgi:phosphoribosylanthranilate isomerase
MRQVELKICGMKNNVRQVAALEPDYLGFIFWESSSRFYDLPTIEELNQNIKKVGVFVDADHDFIYQTAMDFQLDYLQLHGNESTDYLFELRAKIPENIKLIKAFAVDNDFDFDRLKTYEPLCDYFLFDTKGKLPGGNGTQFDWSILKSYTCKHPFFLSGGIGLSSLEALEAFLNSAQATYCCAIDVNSKFEKEPGTKNTTQLKQFKEQLIT